MHPMHASPLKLVRRHPCAPAIRRAACAVRLAGAAQRVRVLTQQAVKVGQAQQQRAQRPAGAQHILRAARQAGMYGIWKAVSACNCGLSFLDRRGEVRGGHGADLR